MIIRTADLEKDALAILNGARDFTTRMSLRHLLPQDDAAFIDTVSRIVSLDGMEILVAEHEGRIVGGIGVLYIPYVWNSAILIAEELFFWSGKANYGTARKLFAESMRRIKERKAMPIFHKPTTSPPVVDRIYQSSGLIPTEMVYTWPSLQPLSH